MKHLELEFEAIGTHWSIQAAAPGSIEHAIMARIADFDATYSRFRNDSLVTKMSTTAGTYALPADGYALIKFYEDLYKVTDGRVTPLIGQVMSDAGYDAGYSFTEHTLQQPARWEDIINYDYEQITLAKPVLLDVGAAGKGYLVDIVGSILEDVGADYYLINAGGDITYQNTANKPVRVGLENPFNPLEVVGVASLHNQSLCASSGSRRKWGQYTHIIDPVSLKSPQDIQATWVVTSDTMTADGLATALFFTEAKKLQRHFNFSFALLHKDMSMEYSSNFPATIEKA